MTMGLKEKVLEVLKKINDPEIPVSIYDLGLIYEVSVKDRNVYIKLTATTPGCPLAFYLPSLVENDLRREIPGLEDIKVELVWDPPWTPSRISEEGRKRLMEIYGRDIVGEWLSMFNEQA